jgi:dipeptidyl aminopeptidase/acylaminoacyl peptidase
MIPEGPYRNQPYLVEIAADGTGLHQPYLVEIAADGSGLSEIRKAGADECCFRWSPDGKYLVYSARASKRWDLWVLPVHGGWVRRSRKPIQLTNGPLSYPQGAIRIRDGKQIFAVGVKERGELVRYDMKSHRFVPLLGGISATDATYSTDGKWVAYSSYPDHILWRSRSDGSEHMQLTYPPLEVQEPFISPDGTTVVFAVASSGVFTIDMNGGPPKRIGERIASPRWSPDGTSIVVESITPEGAAGPLQVVDVRTGKAFAVLESESKLGGPCWLDQETLLVDAEPGKQVTFNLKTGKWTDFYWIDINNLINSPDGKYVYLATAGADPGVVRIRVADRHLETITSLQDFVRVMNFGWTQLRVAPDGSPTLTRALDGPEIYALNVRGLDEGDAALNRRRRNDPLRPS